jgi:hypothetical protein
VAIKASVVVAATGLQAIVLVKQKAVWFAA